MSLSVVSVRINNPSPVEVDNISSRANILVKVNPQQNYKVGAITYGGSEGIRYLRELDDVDASSPANNETIIFNSITQKFESRFMTDEDILLLSIDGGDY